MDLYDIAIAKKLAGGSGGGGGGSSDFTIAEVTVINNSANISNAVIITGCVAVDDENYPTSVGQIQVDPDRSGTKYNYIMYKREATLLISAGVNTSTITVTGDYTTDGYGRYWVTGNCTVTLTD